MEDKLIADTRVNNGYDHWLDVNVYCIRFDDYGDIAYIEDHMSRLVCERNTILKKRDFKFILDILSSRGYDL